MRRIAPSAGEAMKQQYPCPVISVMTIFPTPTWKPEDVVRVFKLVATQIVVLLMIALVVITLLLGGRSVAPLLMGGGLGSPSHFAILKTRDSSEEQELQEETQVLLESFESPAPANPNEPAVLP